MKKIIALIAMLLTVLTTMAQMVDPVKFTATLKTDGTAEGEIVFSGRIEAGWHVYSTNLGQNGPTEASLHVNKADGIQLVGSLMPRGGEKAHYDPIFNMHVRYFEGSAQFVQRVRFTKPTYSIDAYLEYGACSDENCLPPGEGEYDFLKLFSYLKKSGYDKSAIIELYADGYKDIKQIADSKIYLENIDRMC
mgnify:CR=1 FL=1